MTADVEYTMSAIPATPALTITESGGLVCLQLAGVARGRGPSLQEAADDLIQSVLVIVMAFRSSGFAVSMEVYPDFETLDYLAELADMAAGGDDIREVVFG